MKRSHWIFCAVLFVLLVYGFWTVWPHLYSPKVINTAGLTEAELTVIVEQMEAQRAFPGRAQPIVILRNFIKPWTRPDYSVEIETQANVRTLLWLTPYSDYPKHPRWKFMAILEDGDWIVRRAPRPKT